MGVFGILLEIEGRETEGTTVASHMKRLARARAHARGVRFESLRSRTDGPPAPPSADRTHCAGFGAGLRPRMSNTVQILFSSVGSAPVLRQRRVATDGSLTFSSLHSYLLRQLGEETPRLFLFLKSSFQPCSSDSIGSLLAAHGESGVLNVQYAEQPAWG